MAAKVRYSVIILVSEAGYQGSIAPSSRMTLPLSASTTSLTWRGSTAFALLALADTPGVAMTINPAINMRKKRCNKGILQANCDLTCKRHQAHRVPWAGAPTGSPV
jgi:hypothetical protein